MSTEAQVAANRANSQHSTGPKTEEGKANSSQNHRKLGLTGEFHLLPFEDPEDFRGLHARLCTEFQPNQGFESDLVLKMAQHHWIALRAIRAQDFCFEDDSILVHPYGQKQMALLLRYQTTHERAYDRCAKELRTLRNERNKQQIGFESQQRAKAQEVRRESADTRKQELHKLAVSLAETKLEHQNLKNSGLRAAQTKAPKPETDSAGLQTAA